MFLKIPPVGEKDAELKERPTKEELDAVLESIHEDYGDTLKKLAKGEEDN